MYFRCYKRLLPELTINKPLSDHMKLILKTIDPIKYKDLTIKYKPSKKKIKQVNSRTSPW